MGGRLSNVILDPTLALIRAQLGFRIQVRAKCGNNRNLGISGSMSVYKKSHGCSRNLNGVPGSVFSVFKGYSMAAS